MNFACKYVRVFSVIFSLYTGESVWKLLGALVVDQMNEVYAGLEVFEGCIAHRRRTGEDSTPERKK